MIEKYRSTLLLMMCIVGTSCSVTPATTDHPRNVILMIGDGMGFAQIKAYRSFADDPNTPEIDFLAFEPYLAAVVATESLANSADNGQCGISLNDPEVCALNPYAVTESAAAATAYATGVDTLNGRVGTSPEGEVQVNIAEKARRRGKAVGVAVTAQITHATPAAFLAHSTSRYEYSAIADQLFDLQWEGKPLASVLLGGGRADLDRTDRDLTAEFEQAGYTLVSNREELLSANTSHILGLFAPWGLAKRWDREPEVPSLADMTEAAMKALDQNPAGFLLVIEGSQIDWAGHVNDVAGVISEMQDFTEAAERAIAFAKQQGDTLLLITADHETGGMSLGRDGRYEWNPIPMRGLTQTPEAMTMQFINGNEALSQIVAAAVPFELSAEEITRLDSYERVAMPPPEDGVDGLAAYEGINQLMDQRTLTGWTTSGHTGVDVPIYALGPGSEHFHGVIRNEEVGQKIQALFLP